jgi:hypothetical protein
LPAPTRLAGRALMLSISAIVLAVILYFAGVPPCPAAAPFLVAGIVLLAGAIGIGAFADRLCAVRVEAGDGVLRVRLGICGELLIPFDSIVSVRLVDRVEPMLRLAGSAIPGVYYSGYFMLSGGARAYIFSERLERLVEVKLADGKTVYLGGNAAEALPSLPLPGEGAKGGEWVVRMSPAIHRALLLLAAIVAAAGVIAYPYLPSRVPLHFDKNWTPDSWGGKVEALAVYYALAGIGVAMAILNPKLARKDPVASLITSIAAAGLMLLALSTLLLVSPACPWAK